MTKITTVLPDCPNVFTELLPHPNSHDHVKYGFVPCGDSLYELYEISKANCLAGTLSSLLIGDSVQSDGSFLVWTPCDPLFIILGIFYKSGKQNSYQNLNDLLFEFDASALLHVKGLQTRLIKICDVNDVGGEMFYKLNTSNIIEFINAKADKLLAMKDDNNSLLNTRKYLSISDAEVKKKILIRDFLFDYLPSELHTEFHYEEPKVSSIEVEHPDYANTGRTGGNGLEGQGAAKKKAPAKKEKDSVGMAKLKKVNTDGMKKITSFFKKVEKAPAKKNEAS